LYVVVFIAPFIGDLFLNRIEYI